MKKNLVASLSIIGLLGVVGCETSSGPRISGYSTSEQAVTETNATTTTTPLASNPAELWPNVSAPDFLQHGRSGEDSYRSAKVSAANAAGVNCLRVNANYSLSDETAMHLLALEHPSKPGYYLDAENWFFISERRGVTRWIHDLGTPSRSQADRWLYLVKSSKYAGRLQLMCSGATALDVLARLSANPNGAPVIVY